MNKEQNVRMTEKTGIQNLDIRIAIAVVICFLSATACSELGFKFTYGEMHLEILPVSYTHLTLPTILRV